HLNLHSMPNDAYARLGLDPDRELADFVLGDRDGRTCEPAFVDLIASYLQGKGYTVARNDPYKGVQLIEQIGQPMQGRHSLQVEIRRPVYMNEATREPNEGFVRLQQDLSGLLRQVASYVRKRVGRPPTPLLRRFRPCVARGSPGSPAGRRSATCAASPTGSAHALGPASRGSGGLVCRPWRAGNPGRHTVPNDRARQTMAPTASRN